MKIPCNVIQDLLPLYIEKLASKESATLVEEHIKDCNICKNYVTQMEDITANTITQSIATQSLQLVKNNIKKRKIRAIIFSSLIVFLIMFTLFSYLSKPNYLPYSKDNITINALSNGSIYIKFKDNVTAYNTETYIEDGKIVTYIVAWSAIIDKIIEKAPQNSLLLTSENISDAIYYCDYTNEGIATLIHGANIDGNGGRVVLPRLFLTYYFIIALIVTVLFGGIWFVFKNKICKVWEHILYVSIAYLMGQILIKAGFDFVTLSAKHDFIMIVIETITIYGIIIVGLSIFRQYRLDKSL